MTVFLIGYMGSGKSTIGRKLAETLDFEYLDLDAYIETKEQQPISEIFKSKGEIYFRKIESQFLHEVSSMKKAIVSLGGGTPCYGDNMKLIRDMEHTVIIYLKASIPSLVERLHDEKATRPLIAHLKTKDELTEFIGKHLFERSFFYTQADYTISVDKKSVLEITEESIMSLF